ncbi:uncharacterized protein LOC111898097 [Lactuca sativa]|uniref:uncharacterized protein LOC111898097 n=1 Tax=Lactuca sativa TaxID=4236 RepID=UPI000CD9F981|nr:uncharacterized protein LOC111898097 [Lactuca sativa]
MKVESSAPRSYKSKPYSRPDRHRVNALEDEGEEEEPPKITDYCFYVDVSGLIHAMQDLRDKARWIKKENKPTNWKDKSKRCAYHEYFGHMTEDCIALRKEISYLISKRHLKETLRRKKEKSKENNQDGHKIPKKQGSPPPNAKIINVISGGSNICGTSYFQAKRQNKVSKTEKENRSRKNTLVSKKKEITLDETDREGIQDPHHDGLMITMYIANQFVRRILVDRVSSVNIVLLDALKRMNILESEIIKRSSVLIGFSGETKHTIREIKLPIYIEGVKYIQTFCVIDALSSYNVVLGRPWIHEMKEVPSIYLQCVKMPTMKPQQA